MLFIPSIGLESKNTFNELTILLKKKTKTKTKNKQQTFQIYLTQNKPSSLAVTEYDFHVKKIILLKYKLLSAERIKMSISPDTVLKIL